MKNIYQNLAEKRDSFNKKLKDKLDDLSPDSRMNLIFWIISLYLLVTAFVLIDALQGNDDKPVVEHIEPAKIVDDPFREILPDRIDTIYNYESNK